MFFEWTDKQKFKEIDFSNHIFPKANDREFWNTKYNVEVVKAAEEYLGFEWPIIRATQHMAFIKEGNRVAQETPYFARRNALAALFYGELLEYKGRFLPDIVDGIYIICEETAWTISAHCAIQGQNIPMGFPRHIELFSAETSALLSAIYYAFYDELNEFCPEILSIMKKNIKERILDTYLVRTDYWWFGYDSKRKPNNWNPWVLSNVLASYLLMEVERPILDAAIKKLFTEIDNYYNAMPEDGGCDEGYVYWLHAGGKLFEFCNHVYLATNGVINLFKDEKLKNILKFIYRPYIWDNWVVNFADGSPKAVSGAVPILAYMCGLRTEDENFFTFAKARNSVCGVLNSSQVMRSLYSIIYAKDIESLPDKEFSPDEICVLPDLQNCYIRNGKWFYAAKGGFNHESHNHNDVGSFLAFYDNNPVLVDPGCGVYTKKTFSEHRYEIWTMQSGWHNLPVINGCEEPFGAEFKCNRFDVDGKKTVIDFEGAYDKNAGLKSVSRVIEPTDDSILLTDSFVFENASNTVAEHFVTHLDVRVEDGKVVIGDNFMLTTDTDCEILLDYVDFEGDKSLTSSWGTDKMNRIKFVYKTGDKATISIVLRRM
ncbi:MAG: heparinase II/III family protein [Clostridia bacterium]|nr:heparinase II/III family protein [Clostridia bacterium]